MGDGGRWERLWVCMKIAWVVCGAEKWWWIWEFSFIYTFQKRKNSLTILAKLEIWWRELAIRRDCVSTARKIFSCFNFFSSFEPVSLARCCSVIAPRTLNHINWKWNLINANCEKEKLRLSIEDVHTPSNVRDYTATLLYYLIELE